jgi:hypothetical protein
MLGVGGGVMVWVRDGFSEYETVPSSLRVIVGGGVIVGVGLSVTESVLSGEPVSADSDRLMEALRTCWL